MKRADDLTRILRRIDGAGYKAYKEIAGRYAFPEFVLSIDHVQGDPFAAPSRLRVFVPQTEARFPAETHRSKSRAIALSNLLARSFSRAARRVAERRG